MYESFFNLTGKPFQLNPDPRFFFRSTGHKRALAYMRYGLQQQQGFIVVTGDVGTGKSMLVANLFKEIDDEAYVAAKIVSTNVKDVDLLRLIAAEFDIPFERSSKATLLHKLETFFKACRNEGKRILLVIDEAQNLPRSALEELRMLSNFDHDGTPLVQSFLLGQREFRAILRAPGLEQLRQRVIAAYHLKPLSAPEVKAYIEHRMRKVGWENDPEIDDAAYEKIFEVTGGVPRRINTTFDRVLLNCYLDESHRIDAQTVEAVREEIELEQGDGDEEPDARAEMAPVGGSAAAPARTRVEDGTQAELRKLEDRLEEMQKTIEKLAGRLTESRDTDTPYPQPNPMPGKSGWFPVWTTTFVSLLLIVALVGLSVGLWVIKN